VPLLIILTALYHTNVHFCIAILKRLVQNLAPPSLHFFMLHLSVWLQSSYFLLRAFSPQANYTELGRQAAKLAPTSADTECRLVSAMDPQGR
jgi:hypothetical protein